MFNRPPRFQGGPRARRGEIRAGILALLKEHPRNGYQLMQELERRSHGVWRPSPGSVYPTLQMLEDEGLVSSRDTPDGRTFLLTTKGQTWITKNPGQSAEPWKDVADSASGGYVAILDLLSAVNMTTRQIIQLGTVPQKEAVVELLRATRKSLLRVLAEDESLDKP